ncbi:MAG TPA: DUF2694 family protein, partial [Mycolicibacterium fallax]|nr:DUF2694 family protein [Mycolicibacterium fallax]
MAHPDPAFDAAHPSGRVLFRSCRGGYLDSVILTEAALDADADTLAVLARVGSPPLPPYIRKQRRHLHRPDAEPADAQRYNTVYARDPGSVAAPTAGLHFTPGLLADL